MAWMGFVVGKSRLNRPRRLELLAESYFILLLLGILFGGLYLTPNVVRFCLLRADTFLMLYAILLIQIYGATLLASRDVRCPTTTFLLGAFSILLPLSVQTVAPLLFLTLIVATDPRERFERLCQMLAGPARNRFFRFSISQSAGVLCSFAVVLGFLFFNPNPSAAVEFPATDQTE